MNCKQGDLAVVIKAAGSTFNFTLGHFVTCERPATNRMGEQCWIVSPPIPMPWCFCGHCVVDRIPDVFLKPIRKPPVKQGAPRVKELETQ